MEQKRNLSPVIIGAGVAVLAVLLTLVVLTANRDGAGRVGWAGRIAIQAETTLSAVVALQNVTAQAVLVAGVANFDGADPSVAAAVDELGAPIRNVQERTDALVADMAGDEAGEVDTASSLFVDATVAVADLLRAGDADGLDAALILQKDTYEALVVQLVDQRNSRTVDVFVASEGAGRAADVIRFLVVFVLPVAGIMLYRRSTKRRRQHEAVVAELDQERLINSSKDEFLASISHELRTPLTSIYGFALTLEEEGLDDIEASTELVHVIATEAAELARMIEDLLAVGRLQAGEMAYRLEPVDLSAEIDSVVAPGVRRGQNIHTDLEAATVTADALRLRQIIRNLLSNATKHGGDWIRISTETDETRAVVRVTDNGRGVPPETESRLFTRYVHRSNEPVIEGSVGLGLAIARGLAEGMNGTLEYRRADGLTHFELSMPIADSHSETTEATSALIPT